MNGTRSFLRLVSDVAHEALVEQVVGVGRLVVRVALHVHLVPQFLQPALQRVVGRELGAAAVGRLDVLHVLLRLYLDHRRLSEDHSNQIYKR